MCLIIYRLGWDCFERYKVLEEPWPWEENPDAWWPFLMKTIRLHAVNVLLMAPLTFLVYMFIEAETALDCTLEGLPSRYIFVL